MKNLSILFAGLFSYSLFAMSSAEIINYPQHPGSQLSFSATRGEAWEELSDENGICLALGYEKALKDSAKSSQDYRVENKTRDALRVDIFGNVISGRTYFITIQITCLNKREIPQRTSTLYTRKMLIHPDLNLPFSATWGGHWTLRSKEEGICNLLGHKKAAFESARSSEDYRVENKYGDSVQVDQFGNVVGLVESYRTIQIVCLD